MDLKLHRYYNLSTTLLKNKYNVGAVIFTSQNTQISLKNELLKFVSSSGFYQLQLSMDRLLDQSNREYVRNTMLRQEEVFKKQVRELHRLYRVQKILLAEVKSKEMATARSTSETSHTAPQLNSEHNYLRQHSTVSEESSLKHKSFDLEWPNEESEIELSLSIGCSSSKKKTKPWIHSELKSESKPLLLSNKRSRPERGDECNEREQYTETSLAPPISEFEQNMIF